MTIWYNSRKCSSEGEKFNSVDYDELVIEFDKTKNLEGIKLPAELVYIAGKTVNPPRKVSGRADIYKTEGVNGTTYLWEVKPRAYFIYDATRADGEMQLAKYVFYGKGNLEFGQIGAKGSF